MGDLCSMHKGLAQFFDEGGFREDRPAVACSGAECKGWCALRMRLKACSGAERQNGMEQRISKGLRHEKLLLWEREVALMSGTNPDAHIISIGI